MVFTCIFTGMELNERFAANARARREALGLSVRELGKRMDPPVSGARVSMMENGLDNVTLKSLQRFAKALNCAPLSLLR